MSKLFTALLHKRLEKWSVKENVLLDNSLGFRKGLRTEDGMFILTTLLDKYAKRGERIFSCFVDFAKFYDSISHNLLFIKLAEKGISGNFYFLLKNMYSNCSYAIKVLLPCDPLCGEKNTKNKTNSYQWFRNFSFRAKTGLKQGYNLSPLLANIFLSDLHESPDIGHYYHQESVTSISWADDLLILSMNSAGLQKCIENLEEYTKKWGLMLSMKKTRCVIFSKTKTRYAKEVPFIYNNEPIPFETFYKYLGVEIANNCEFNIVKKERNIKARKAIFSIRQALAASGNVSVKLAMKLFGSK